MGNGAMWIWLLLQFGMLGYIFYRNRKVQRPAKPAEGKRSARAENSEMHQLDVMRKRSLNTPLSERARPGKMNEIIGQEDGIRALRAAMCGPNPQHVLIYGPPGCGKTCAARLVLEEAKRREKTGELTITQVSKQS